jgi:hypothetical protein
MTPERRIEKQLNQLRSQWKNWRKAAPLLLPTGFVCCEACDHASELCAVQGYVRNTIETRASELQEALHRRKDHFAAEFERALRGE